MDNKKSLPIKTKRRGSLDGFVSLPPKSERNVKSSQLIANNVRKNSGSPIRISDVSENKQALSPSARDDNLPSDNAILNKTMPGALAHSVPSNMNRRSGKSHKKRSKKKAAVFSIVVFLLLAIGIGGWQVWQDLHKVKHLRVSNLTAAVGGAENILVAGSTNRCNLKVQNAEWGFCSQGVTGVNSDIIFIIHLVPKTRTVSILSIPRDTFVPNARSGDQAFKIDAALYEGPTQLVNAVEEDFGIPIQHYVEVGFDGFVNIVNAVGGIKMDFPMPVYDSESYLKVQTAGCYKLNGIQALQVVRARHLQYKPATITTNDTYYWPQETESDMARITRTHEFLRVLASTVTSQGLGNPITDQKLLDAIGSQVQVDSGLSNSAILNLAEEFHSVNINKIQQYTLPVSSTDFSSYTYDGYNYGDVTFPSEGADQQVINEFLGSSNTTDTMTGRSLPKAALVNVNVINGSDTPEQATQVSSALQALGFNIASQPGSATPLSSEAIETVVAYAGRRTEAKAEAVARQLSGPVILSQNSSLVTSGSDVTVITGTGLSVNSSAASTTSSASDSSDQASASSSSSSSSTSSSATDLAQPNQAIQPLSAWDPRACSANQVVIVNSKV